MLEALIRRRPPGRRHSRGSSLVRGAVAVSVALAVAGPSRAAEEMSITPDLQIPIILKILTYDRHLLSRYGNAFTLGVLYAPADPESVKAANAVADYMYQARGKTVKTLPVSYFLLEYTSPENLERSIATRGIDVLYVAPGNAKNVAAITKISQKTGVTTTTGIPDYVRSGVAVGVALSQGHLQYLVNLTSARAEGAEFDASLLRISTIVK